MDTKGLAILENRQGADEWIQVGACHIPTTDREGTDGYK
jgi:hypothetical protein